MKSSITYTQLVYVMNRFLKVALIPVVLVGAIVVCSAQSAEAVGPFVHAHARHVARRAAFRQAVLPVRPVAIAYRAPIVYPVARPVIAPVITPVITPVVTPVVTHRVHYPVIVPAYRPAVTYGSYYIGY